MLVLRRPPPCGKIAPMSATDNLLPVSAWPYTHILMRLALGLALGLLIGLERERRGKEAGLRTFGFIGLLGTTILWADPFRVAQLTGKADFRNLEALIIAAIVYWGLTAIFSFFQRKLEARMSKGYVRTAVKAG